MRVLQALFGSMAQAPELRGKLGERFLRLLDEVNNTQEDVWEALFNAVGLDYPGELTEELPPTWKIPWPLEDITFDPYDASFEFKGCRNDWEPTAGQMQACLDLGFNRCWLCWQDGTERYYGPEADGIRRVRA